MPERLLSGADTRFSACFLSMNYRYSGRKKLTERQRNSLKNIHSKNFNAPIIEDSTPLNELRSKFKVGLAGNFSESILINLEQTDTENVFKAVNESVEFFNTLSDVSFDDIVIASVAGNNINLDVAEVVDTVIKRRGAKCEFGFIYEYVTDKSWDKDFIRGNTVSLESRNPDIRKIIDINKDTIREDRFRINPEGRLNFEFTIEQDTITLDEITAVTNAVEGFAQKAVEGSRRNQRDVKPVTEKLTLV